MLGFWGTAFTPASLHTAFLVLNGSRGGTRVAEAVSLWMQGRELSDADDGLGDQLSHGVARRVLGVWK